MSVIRLIACALLVVVLAGCAVVASKQPVGETPLSLDDSDWEGTWLTEDGTLTVRVVDAEQGLLQVAWVEQQGGEFVLETIDVMLRQYRDWTFASFAGVEEGQSDLLWSRLDRNERQLFLWAPRPEEFKRLVEEGLLPGAVTGDDVLLERLDADHLAILVSEEHGVLFDWDEPMALHRLGGK